MAKNSSDYKETAITEEKTVLDRQKVNLGGLQSIKKFLTRFKTEDIILFVVLFLLIDEGINDEFLILIIVILILTDEND